MLYVMVKVTARQGVLNVLNVLEFAYVSRNEFHLSTVKLLKKFPNYNIQFRLNGFFRLS